MPLSDVASINYLLSPFPSVAASSQCEAYCFVDMLTGDIIAYVDASEREDDDATE